MTILWHRPNKVKPSLGLNPCCVGAGLHLFFIEKIESISVLRLFLPTAKISGEIYFLPNKSLLIHSLAIPSHPFIFITDPENCAGTADNGCPMEITELSFSDDVAI